MSRSSDCTLLIVEDEPNDRFLIERALRKAKIANPIQMVVDGDEALTYLRGEGRFADRNTHPLPMVMLLDLKLPRRSGLEVLAWVRSSEKHRTLPIVVLTSSVDTEDVRRAYELGANSYLVKPVEFEGLKHMIETAGLYWLILNRPPPEIEQ